MAVQPSSEGDLRRRLEGHATDHSARDEMIASDAVTLIVPTRFDDAVASLNTAVVTLPWMVFAPMAAVHKRDFYEAPDTHQAPPQVAF